ncbi:MAG: flagellar biosynthesis protein FlhF, partial [Limnobacter sp.]|nr:flagellar biosynthesis protein FlhF [Limnobacter sp.]
DVINAAAAEQEQPQPAEPRQPVSWTKADREKQERNRKLSEAIARDTNEKMREQLREQSREGVVRQPAQHQGLPKVNAAYGVQPQKPAQKSAQKPVAKTAQMPVAKPENLKQASHNAQAMYDVQDEMISSLARNRAQAASESMMVEQANMLEEIKQMRQMMKDQLSLMTWRDSMEKNPLRGEIWSQLNNAGFSPLFARTVAEKLPEGMTEEKAQDWLTQVLIRNLSIADQKDDLVDKGGVYALVGPTGVGKTTTTAKLAARCVVKYGADSLGLITTDSYRIGAQDQLRIYGKILGVQVYTAQNEADLTQLRNSLSRKRLLLIDTVGMGQRDKRVGEQTDMLVNGHVKRLLLLNTTSQAENLDEVVRHYRNRGLEGAIMTKLDESVKLGGALDVVMRHKLKLHYMATGQRVPEDLFLADPRILVHRALKTKNSSAFSPSSQELKWKMAQTPSTAKS